MSLQFLLLITYFLDCHAEPNLEDLGLAFNDTGVLVHELEDFVTQVDQVPFSYQLPRFPMPKPNVLHHPHKEEIVDRPEFYHEHLPPLIKALQQNEGRVLLLCTVVFVL